MLNEVIALEAHFNPEKVEADLLRVLEQKSSNFVMGLHSHTYSHTDPIFSLTGPIAESQRQAIKKCPSCRHEFSNRGEMVFCTFCGRSNDEKCLKKTRIYPQAPPGQGGKPAARGKICKLCDRKFRVHVEADKAYRLIQTQKLVVTDGLRKLQSKGKMAKDEINLEGEANTFTQRQIQEVDEDLEHMTKELVRLKQEAKDEKHKSSSVYLQKEQLEKEVRKMQDDTEKLELLYKDLLLLTDEFKLIKKNELPSMLEDNTDILSPKRKRDHLKSDVTESLEMLSDGDLAEEDGQGEQGSESLMFDDDETGRFVTDTLSIARHGSTVSD